MGDDEQEGHGDDIRDYVDTHGHWLDYEINHQFDSAAPPARLVRFMPLEQYLAILTSRQLYIPRATEYDDPYDCAFPDSLSDEIREALLESCDEPEFSLPGDADHHGFVRQAESLLDKQLREELSGEIAERWFVSCWHAGDALTDLMWRSYGGHKGVCVTCDGPALLKQLQDSIWVRRYAREEGRGLERFQFLYGYVDYEESIFNVEVDHDSGPTVTVRHPAFHKNKFFRLDQEYRFAAKLTVKDVTQFSVGAALDLAACNASVSTSPLCPLWIAKSVEDVTRKFYPTIPIHHLSLESE